jgi:uncharacterized membrane protein YraQ (UPF0718 family)
MRLSGNIIFLSIVIIAYLALGIADFNLMKLSIFNFGKLFLKILPILCVVFILIFLSNLFLKPKQIAKHFGEGSGILSWIITIIGGIISMGSAYIWYIFLKDLKQKGMKTSLIVAFLYNRAIKIPLLPMMIYYFGYPLTIILTIYMIIFSVINGLVVEKMVEFP